MSSNPAEGSATSKSIEQTKPVDREREMSEANHDLPAGTTEETKEESHDHHEKDDPATMAASEELKHTSISDRILIAPEDHPAVTEDAKEDNDMKETAKAHTPEPEASDVRDEDMREQISSPKKKRGRDIDDDAKESVTENETLSVVNGRTARSEPEKKRPRDTSIEPGKTASSLKDADSSPKTTPADGEATDRPTTKATSSSAFASSGFAALASSSSSPFGTIGASKPSVFSGNVNTSGFGASGGKSSTITSTITTTGLGTSENKPASGFGFGGGFGGATTSGFGGLGSGSVFSSALGNGFAGGSGPKLSSFAAPIKDSTLDAKPTKAFGAPETDEGEGSDRDDSEGGTDTDEEEGRASPEEKRKIKTTKVEDGEAGEATLLQLRAKLFALESKEAGWKERGVGTLKVNVPKSCASYDENGAPLSGSFDISGLEDEDEEDTTTPRVPRLIMRQENTHRVILNTIIVRAMEFQDKPSTSAAQLIFTAFEGEKEPKPIQMLLRLSESNARLFKSEIASIQREL